MAIFTHWVEQTTEGLEQLLHSNPLKNQHDDQLKNQHDVLMMKLMVLLVPAESSVEM